MGRIIAVDYGSKRVGLAVTDSLQMIATGLNTIAEKEAIGYLKNYIKTEKVDCIVVGEPKNLDNTPASIAEKAAQFANKLKGAFPDIEINQLDERFTSKIAFQSMIDSGLKKKNRQNKALVDEISATLILQTYLEKVKI